MKYKKKFAMLPVVFAVLLAAGGCISVRLMEVDKLMKMQKGMSKAGVKELFGLPNYRQLDSEGEVWEYKYFSYSQGDDYLNIRFVDDKVESFDSYFMPACKEIQKQQIPNKATTGN